MPVPDPEPDPARPPDVRSDASPVGPSAVPSAWRPGRPSEGRPGGVPVVGGSGGVPGRGSAGFRGVPGVRRSGCPGVRPGPFRFGCGSSLIVLPCSCFRVVRSFPYGLVRFAPAPGTFCALE
ncbi:hypothetical protein GCM10027075_00390 [Streptomyces heilongjiangensis]